MPDESSLDPGAISERFVREEFQRLVDRVRLLEEVADRQERLLDSIPAAIVVTDAAGTVNAWNAGATALFGWRPDEIIGQPYEARFPAPVRGGVADMVQTVRDGRALTGEWEDYRKDGSRVWVDSRMQPILDDDARVVAIVGVSRDITERKTAEWERQTIEARLTQAKTLESLGALAGGVAHDFNNLLTSVLGNTDLALAHVPPSSPARAYLKHIEHAAHRAAELTRQMLAYSGRGQFLMRPLSLAEAVRGKRPLFQTLTSDHVTLEIAAHDDIPVEGDAEQIGQLLVSLVVNAVEAIGVSRGTVRLSTGAAYCTRSDLACTYLDESRPEGWYAYIEVSDTGSGMSGETMARMFEPFFTTKFTGRGLGLAAVLGIMRGHRGAIQVSSELGRGTTVRVLFPALKRELPVRGDAPANGPASARVQSVLVVDDEETVRNVARTILERAGFRVLLAASGAEAIARFREESDQIDAILLDLSMPLMSGRQVFEALTHIRQGVPIILSSGYLQDEAVARLEGGTVAGFLQKPYRFDELVSSVRRAVRPPDAAE